MGTSDIVYTFITSVIALFPVVNPFGNGFIVNSALSNLKEHERSKAVRKIVLNCLVTAVGSLMVGHIVLLLFGLAIPAIQLGGGILICKTAWKWLDDPAATTENKGQLSNNTSLKEISSKLFYPLSFPVVIGPGSISVIFTLMANSAVKGNYLMTGLNYLMIILSIIVLLGLLYFLLMHGSRIIRRFGSATNLVINKFVAFITFCIGIQIIIQGLSHIFNLNIV